MLATLIERTPANPHAAGHIASSEEDETRTFIRFSLEHIHRVPADVAPRRG
jgi:hypothetical protein